MAPRPRVGALGRAIVGVFASEATRPFAIMDGQRPDNHSGRHTEKSCLLRTMEYHDGMVTLTIKLTEELKEQLQLQAKQSGQSISALIREAVSDRLRRSKNATSLYDRTRDLCGKGGSGRPDLATNPDHLRSFGE